MTIDLEQIARLAHEPDDRLRASLATTDGDLVILGAGGKMGVSLARMAREALDQNRQVIAVSRFSDDRAQTELEGAGVRTLVCDLEDDTQLTSLPDAANVVFMVGRKFGTSADSASTWATNAYLPGRVVQRFAGSRIVAFSSGNVYPLTPVGSGGADESVEPGPIGEYAQSCLGRERVLAFQARKFGCPLSLIRLNYAVDCRYGVLTDIALTIRDGRPVDVSNGSVNVVWQGDANRYALGSLALADLPPLVLNVTGPETSSVRWLALELGRRLGRDVETTGQDGDTALLSNAGRCFGLFGYPHVPLATMLDWTAAWIAEGGQLLGKPTHFAERAGRF